MVGTDIFFLPFSGSGALCALWEIVDLRVGREETKFLSVHKKPPNRNLIKVTYYLHFITKREVTQRKHPRTRKDQLSLDQHHQFLYEMWIGCSAYLSIRFQPSARSLLEGGWGVVASSYLSACRTPLRKAFLAGTRKVVICREPK